MPVQYKLVITEKPSVAKAYADVLGAKKRQGGYYSGNGYLISWCVGHLVELVMPQDYDEKYRRWLAEDLPIIPAEWKYRITSSTRKQFNILEKLMKRKDVKEILCATDAGREGELIFRLVYQMVGCKKPFKRIWLSSMEDAAIKEAFAHPRPGAEYDRLYEAARCREQADWIVGINATRLFSCLYRDTLNIGRVMTPTLAMVVDREATIAEFVSEPFYTVRLTAEDTVFESERFKEKEEALQAARRCKAAREATVSDVIVKKKKEQPPLLFDLTTLQREANRRFGFSAQQTLDYAQSLYEKKLLTYPRTDSRYLTSNMEQTIPALIRKAVEKTTGEAAILQMVLQRLLAATSTAFLYEETKVILSCGGEEFAASGKRILDPGWKKYESDNAKEVILPEFRKGKSLAVEEVSLKEGKTKPPARFTEGTLLHAMETAGKEDIPEEAEHSGIGTPATRAGIIEKLVRIGFLQRSGDKKTKSLVPTEKGIFLAGILPESLRSVAMTADWEKKLLEIETGTLQPENFMAEIGTFIGDIIREEKAKPHRPAAPGGTYRKNNSSSGSASSKSSPAKKKTFGPSRKRRSP